MSEIKIIPIKTSLPFPPNHTNAYFISIDNYSFLFDTTLNLDNEIEKIKNVVTQNGSIDGIILSHGHLDHAGCAKKLSNMFDVPIYISFDEKERVSGDFDKRVKRRIEKVLKILDFFEFDKSSTQQEFEKIKYYQNLTEPIDVFFNVTNLNIAGLKFIQLKGHTAGSIALLFEKEKLLLSGDAFLCDGISPFFDPEIFNNALLEYENTLNYLKNLNLSKIFPGHGNTCDSPNLCIKKHKKYIEETQEKIKTLTKEGVKCSHIYKKIFPQRYNVLIALAEIIAAFESLGFPILQSLRDLLSE